MDRICAASNFERHVELSITINDPFILIELRDVEILGTLGARVDCIHYIPVKYPTLGIRAMGKKVVEEQPLTGAIEAW